MPNADTFAVYYGGTGRNQILPQTLATATETEFKLGNDTSVTTNVAVLSVPQQTAIQGAGTPTLLTVNPAIIAINTNPRTTIPPYNSGVFDNDRPFLVRLCGTITPASNAGNSYKATLYLGTTKAGVALTNVTAAAQATSVAPFGFILEAELHWDSLAQVVLGQYWYDFNAPVTRQYSTWITTTNPTTATAAAVANLQFCATSTWGNAAGGVAAVSEFSISQL